MFEYKIHESKIPTRCSIQSTPGGDHGPCRRMATDEQTPAPSAFPRPQAFFNGEMVCDECVRLSVGQHGPLAVARFESYAREVRELASQRGNAWQKDMAAGWSPNPPRVLTAEDEAFDAQRLAAREAQERREAAQKERAAARERALDRLIDEEIRRGVA